MATSILSAKIKEEQNKAELCARKAALKRKQELEMEKLRLQQQTEELDLKTEMDISDAKHKVLEQYSDHSNPGDEEQGAVCGETVLQTVQSPSPVKFTNPVVNDASTVVKGTNVFAEEFRPAHNAAEGTATCINDNVHVDMSTMSHGYCSDLDNQN